MGKFQLVGGSVLGRASPALPAALGGVGTNAFVSPGEMGLGF